MLIMEQYLTPEEVAEKLKLHPDTVKRLLRQGKIPGVKIEGSWRISISELNAYLDQQRKKHQERQG